MQKRHMVDTMRHALDEHPLPGIDDQRREKLARSGISSLEDVVSAGAAKLATLTGFDDKTARALVRVAEAVIQVRNPRVILLPQQEPNSVRLLRGLDAARALEESLGCLRQADDWLRQPISDKNPGRLLEQGRAKRQLKKLRKALASLQRQVLAEGSTTASLEHIRNALHPLQVIVGVTVTAKLRRKRLVRLSEAFEEARSQLNN